MFLREFKEKTVSKIFSRKFPSRIAIIIVIIHFLEKETLDIFHPLGEKFGSCSFERSKGVH